MPHFEKHSYHYIYWSLPLLLVPCIHNMHLHRESHPINQMLGRRMKMQLLKLISFALDNSSAAFCKIQLYGMPQVFNRIDLAIKFYADFVPFTFFGGRR